MQRAVLNCMSLCVSRYSSSSTDPEGWCVGRWGNWSLQNWRTGTGGNFIFSSLSQLPKQVVHEACLCVTMTCQQVEFETFQYVMAAGPQRQVSPPPICILHLFSDDCIAEPLHVLYSASRFYISSSYRWTRGPILLDLTATKLDTIIQLGEGKAVYGSNAVPHKGAWFFRICQYRCKWLQQVIFDMSLCHSIAMATSTSDMWLWHLCVHISQVIDVESVTNAEQEPALVADGSQQLLQPSGHYHTHYYHPVVVVIVSCYYNCYFWYPEKCKRSVGVSVNI